MTAAEFEALLGTVAQGWREGDARLAADCFADDALYTEPQRQRYRGRAELYRFFGGDEGFDRPMRMEWHTILFDERRQLGAGEYTFELNHRYHGLVLVAVRDGLITTWREYQYESGLSWREFVR